MIDMKRLEMIVAEFAKKHNFLQWKDIASVVMKSKPMFTKKQLQMDGKSYVYIEKKKDNTYVFICKIYFNLESLKEDIYSVDTEDIFAINVSDFSDEQTLIETMIDKCKEYNQL